MSRYLCRLVRVRYYFNVQEFQSFLIPLPDWNRGQVLGGDSTIPLVGGDSTISLLGGVRGGSLCRETSVNPVRKFGRGFKPLPHCIFSNAALSDGDSFLTGGIF